MEKDGNTFRESIDFGRLERLPADLYWLNTPPDYDLVSQGNHKGLRVMPAGQTDFWQRTFYSPPLVKTNGHALLREVPARLEQWSAEVRFSLEDARHQFDQAGLMVYSDPEHWLKAGVEVVDGAPRMSCVVTSGCSDWSVVPWQSVTDVALRISYIRNSFALEYEAAGKWHFYRIAPSTTPAGSKTTGVGVFCCAPKEAGMATMFHSFSVSDSVSFDHHS